MVIVLVSLFAIPSFASTANEPEESSGVNTVIAESNISIDEYAAANYDAIQWDAEKTYLAVVFAKDANATNATGYTFKGGYSTVAGAAEAVGFVSGSKSVYSDCSDFVILLTAGYTHLTPLDVSDFSNNVVIDLGGNTVEISSNYGFLWLNSTETKDLEASKINIKNGTFDFIKGGTATSIIRLESKEKGTYLIDFDNIKISVNNEKTSYVAISTDSDCTNDIKVKSIFTNCEFDYTNIAARCYMFASGGVGLIDATIENCKIFASSTFSLIDNSKNSIQSLVYYKGYNKGQSNHTSNDDITFGAGNKLLLTENADTPEATTLNLGFAYSKTEGGYDVYDIVEKHTYGDIPIEYYNYKDKYPILLFKEDKTFVGGYDKFSAAASAAGLIGGGDDTNYVILFRRDFDNAAHSGNITDYYNNVTIDLGGFTVNSTTSFLFLYSGTTLKDLNKTTFGTITVKNGSFDLITSTDGASIVRLDGNRTKTENPISVTYPISFENVKFTTTNTSSKASLVVASTASMGNNGGNNINKVDITLTDCTFDYTDAPAKCYMLASGNERTIKATVKGGEIIASGNSAFALNDTATLDSWAFTYYAKPFDDTVTFEANDSGKYTKLTLKEGVTLPDYTVNGGELTFIKNATGEGTVTYTLVPTSATENFTPEANITLDSKLIFNIYLPTTKSVVALALNGEEREIKVEDGYYVISEPLKPYEAAKTLTLEVTIEVDGTKLKGTFTFSVADYANTIINGEGYSTEEQALAKDMLSYVRACYNFFVEANNASYKDYNTAEEIARVNGMIDGIIGEDTAYVPTGTAKTPESGSGFSAVTFYLGDAPAFRFYYTSASAPAYSYKIGSYEIPESDIVMGTDTNGNYVEIKVYAYQLISDLTFTDGNKTYTYNVYSYYAQASEAAKTLVGRLIKYSESAKNYRDSVIDPQA